MKAEAAMFRLFCAYFVRMNMHRKNWKRYLERHTSPVGWKGLEPTPFAMCVVIPCYNEPDINQTLASIWQAKSPGVAVAVVVVVNAGEHASKEILAQNRRTYSDLVEFSQQQQSTFLSLLPLYVEGMKRKHAGVGYARKMGMDYAVQLFYDGGNPDGIIVSLDADCTVDSTFFEAIYLAYKEGRPGIVSHYFEHPLQNTSDSKGIIQYELYLRYFKWALWFSGFPYAIHTVGSSFSVLADVYVRHGGMNRKQGGEDFYFLHKIVPNERHFTLTSTTVYPSARLSDRVPFGTGPSLLQLQQNKSDFRVYSMESIYALRTFFTSIPSFYSLSETGILEKIRCFDKPLQRFLENMNLMALVAEVKSHVASEEAFVKRMFTGFNAFKTVQFLNEAHGEGYAKIPVGKAAQCLLHELQMNAVPGNEYELLLLFRQLDKGQLVPGLIRN